MAPVLSSGAASAGRGGSGERTAPSRRIQPTDERERVELRIKDLTEQLLPPMSLGLGTLPEAFLADGLEMIYAATGEVV